MYGMHISMFSKNNHKKGNDKQVLNVSFYILNFEISLRKFANVKGRFVYRNT